MSEQDRKRFAAKHAVSPTGCWLWTASVNHKGYGHFHLNGRLEGAHRASLILSGQEILKGMVVDHLCRNRACVNPEHLRIVDARTNVTENTASPSFLNSIKTHCNKGHELTGENVIHHQGVRRRCRECAVQANRDYRARKAAAKSKEKT